ncbi:hypothetical protein [Bradyrhizobium sp. CCBAU 53421]|uniref:hypothetical protein n=1 Tax=Bradyrhizobium sp. CCBAU 53421 TaxID=1325120 RepID=UPI00188CAE71|nr:hypothetical protein [Bradyrhizobium sp. CCBAU 53421]
MKNAVRSDQESCEPYGADVAAGAPGRPSSRRLVDDRFADANVMRHRTMEQDTIDPSGVRLPHDIISEMEAALKQQVDRLVAKRH